MKAVKWLLVGVFAVLSQCSPTLPSSTPLGGEDEGEPDAPDGSAPKKRDAGLESAPTPPPSVEAPADSGVDAEDAEADALDAQVDADASRAPNPTAAAEPCKNSEGNPPGCGQMSDQCPGGKSVTYLCQAMRKVLQPRPAEKIIACFAKAAAAGELCGKDEAIENCVRVMLKGSCAEKDTEKFCTGIEQACPNRSKLTPEFNRENCVKGFSAMRPEYRNDLAECLKKSCDLSDCAGMTLMKSGIMPGG